MTASARQRFIGVSVDHPVQACQWLNGLEGSSYDGKTVAYVHYFELVVFDGQVHAIACVDMERAGRPCRSVEADIHD